MSVLVISHFADERVEVVEGVGDVGVGECGRDGLQSALCHRVGDLQDAPGIDETGPFLLLRCRAEEGLKGGDGDTEVEGSASQPRDAVSHQGELTLLALVIRGRQDSDCRVGPRRQDWDSAADLFPGHSQPLPPLGRRSDPASRQANTGSAHRPGACASRTCTYVARTVTYVKEHRSASVLLAGLAAVLDFSGRRRTVMDDRGRRPGTELRRELRLEPNDARPPMDRETGIVAGQSGGGGI